MVLDNAKISTTSSYGQSHSMIKEYPYGAYSLDINAFTF